MKRDRQHAFLHVRQVHQPREQQRPHLADRGADRMALLTVQVPELDGVVGITPVGIAGRSCPFGKGGVHLAGGRPRHRQPRQVALHVGDDRRHARRREAFDDPLERHRLAGAGRAGDQPVAVGARKLEHLGVRSARVRADEDAVRRHARAPIASRLVSRCRAKGKGRRPA